MSEHTPEEQYGVDDDVDEVRKFGKRVLNVRQLELLVTPQPELDDNVTEIRPWIDDISA